MQMVLALRTLAWISKIFLQIHVCKTVTDMKNKSGTIPANSADLGSVTLGWGM